MPEIDSSLVDHPVSLGNYHCPTVMLDELATCAAAWVGAGVERAVISAPAGFGKTYATQRVSQHLVLEYPEVGFARVSCNASGVSGLSVGAFTTFSPDGEPAAPISLDSSGMLRTALVDFVNRTGQPTIVLWVDEAHLLSTSADDTLRRLKDELENVEIRLVIILVGQPSVSRLNEKRVSFSDDITRIVPSQHVDEFALRGLRSVSDIEHSLDAFDTICFPRGSGWSYTRFFLPDAFKDGLRLKKHASALWRVFLEEDRGNDGRAGGTEVPIVCYLRAVEYALINGPGRDLADFRADEEFWREAVLQSGWIARQNFQMSLRGLNGSGDLY